VVSLRVSDNAGRKPPAPVSLALRPGDRHWQGSMTNAQATAPRRHLHSFHAMLLALGMIMSTDSLKTAPTVAANVGHWHFVALWVAGGLASVVGALYAWSRFAIMHTGWVALMAHLAADYVAPTLGLGAGGRMVFAIGIVAVLCGLNVAHVRLGFLTQALLVLLVATGFASVVAAGMIVPPGPVVEAGAAPAPGQLAVALIYIFLAYGGWSDAATLSAEVRSGRHGMLIAVIGSIGLLSVIYVGLNWAMMRGLGEAELAHSSAPAAELARRAFGWGGEALVGAVVAVSAIASINSTIIVCARTTYAAARDIPGLERLAHWHPTRGTPTRTVIAVGVVSLLLTLASGLTGSGFSTMVDYMTPVYWLFVGLGMAAAIRLRIAHPDQHRPIRTPLFPLFPVSFLALAAYMLYASLTQLGWGAAFGAGVLALGGVLLRLVRPASALRHQP